MSETVSAEHPFAAYVRILGKGKSGSRSLTQSEAREAFSMILKDAVEPLQLGAFLMLLRVKEESAAELAGFVEACRDTMISPPASISAELDWSSYAGKKHQHPWYILSMLLLAEAGYRVFIHGAGGHTPGRLYTGDALQQLGLSTAQNWQDVEQQLAEQNFSYLALNKFSSALYDLLQLKPLLGLRSPVNTLTRMLNPLQAPASIQSIFHPAYALLHQDCDALLEQHSSLVFKGDSGEVEIRPHADTRLMLQFNGQPLSRELPRTLTERAAAVAQPSVEPLQALWLEQREEAYGLLATLSTTAAALLLLEPSLSNQSAMARAKELWQNRKQETLARAT
ncbi:glycosyl transferase family protein [Parahaliea sp. F7430]|uniref:Glycosyl transferase family protein n=1 Tax=Sediminihaliea albiluteola TaxID=2758564 RepID=A0A7W2TUK9_9GAMM|nr:glycosyl transferase family protein [Sediminihaliea albiluteola]MBA6412165.1 glycosyl transferase family protein [Sediminihaliea albiluteola]